MLYIVDFYIVTRIIIKNDSVQNTIFLCTFRFGGYTIPKIFIFVTYCKMQYDILEAFLLFLLIEKFGDLRYEKK